MTRALALPACLLASLLLLTSCFMPGTKQLEQPQTDSAEFARYVNPQQLTEQSLATLTALDMRAAYASDPDAVIQRLKASVDTDPSAALRTTLTELCADTGTNAARTHWQQAVAYHLAAAELAFQPTAEGPGLTLGEPMALAAYNYSTGQVAHLLFEAGSLELNGETFAGPWRDYTLYNRAFGKHPIKARDLDSLVPAAFIKLKHTEVKRERSIGFGAALVGHHEATPADNTHGPFMPATGLALPVNATLDYSEPDRVLLDFHDASTTTVTTLGTRSVPLAADYTAALMTIYSNVEDPHAAWQGMRHPDQYLDLMGLYQLEWFQPDKIPVIFSHGLISSPKIWLPGLNALFADPIIRSRFQLYVFRYSSGFPIAYNAAALRRWLVAFQSYYDPQRSNANFRKLLIVGHSMGGLLSSMQIRDSGDSLAGLMFNRPIDEVRGLDDEEKRALQELLIYEANPDIQRAVFVATPHLGSNDASGLRGIIGSKLINYPNDFLITSPLNELDDLTDYGRERVNSRPDGINALQPHAPQLTAISQQPISSGVVYHSIIGQKHPHKPLAESSDGTVAYWSSHLDGAASEKIVFDSHTPMVENPDTIEELRRILYLHAGVGEAP